MARRKAVTTLIRDPQAAHEFIEDSAKKITRENHTWDENHPVKGYYVPDAMRESVALIRSFCRDQAREQMTSAGSVAQALITYSLEQVRKGTLPLEARTDPSRRTMTLIVVDEQGWPMKDKPIVAQKKKEPKQKELFIGARWGRDVDTQIAALSKDKSIPRGELVVFLLMYAVEKFKSQKLHFKAEPVTAKQVVSWPS